MDPLIYIGAVVAVVFVLILMYMRGAGSEDVSSDEERDVEKETPSEMKKNLEEFEEEMKEEQPAENEIGYYGNK